MFHRVSEKLSRRPTWQSEGQKSRQKRGGIERRERKKNRGVIDKGVQRKRSQLGGYPHQLFAAVPTRKKNSITIWEEKQKQYTEKALKCKISLNITKEVLALFVCVLVRICLQAWNDLPTWFGNVGTLEVISVKYEWNEQPGSA